MNRQRVGFKQQGVLKGRDDLRLLQAGKQPPGAHVRPLPLACVLLERRVGVGQAKMGVEVVGISGHGTPARAHGQPCRGRRAVVLAVEEPFGSDPVKSAFEDHPGQQVQRLCIRSRNPQSASAASRRRNQVCDIKGVPAVEHFALIEVRLGFEVELIEEGLIRVG